jgi:hypothetical protein
MAESLDQQLSRVFGKYIELSHKLPGELVTKKAGQLAVLLYRGCADHKATASRIAADVKKQGWALRTPTGFRAAHPEFRRQKGEPDNSAALARFQAAVIALRIRGQAFIAVQWLVSAKKLGAAPKSNVRADKLIYGECEVIMEGARGFVTMKNFRNGVQDLMGKYPIASRAIQTLIDDMQLYIADRLAGGTGESVGGRW